MILKDTEHRRLRIVHLLHSFGTGGMEKGIAEVSNFVELLKPIVKF